MSFTDSKPVARAGSLCLCVQQSAAYLMAWTIAAAQFSSQYHILFSEYFGVHKLESSWRKLI